MNKRETKQYILPVKKDINYDSYDIYPTFPVKEGVIQVGYENLAKVIEKEEVILFDGYVGVFWDDIVEKTSLYLGHKKIKWINIVDCFNKEEDINKLIEPFMGGDDPIFGHRFNGSLEDFFDFNKINDITIDTEADINIIYGMGSFLTNISGLKIYMDIPKNEIQFRARAQAITNLGASKPMHPKKMYKRFYFIDWIVLNKHKQQNYREIDYIVDGQRLDEITFMNKLALQNSIESLKNNCFRVRPWFEPGAWGGQFMKEYFKGLANDVPNYGWSFELIVPENGLIFGDYNGMLEVSFDFIMYHNNVAILGEKGAERFGYEFPIRIDYLDTIDGGNLSVQCHPRTEYIKREFGENYTQDETYYIMECSNDAEVYLGFQEDIDKDEFKGALEQSQMENQPINIEKFVQKHSAKKHDLFLIPNGTIHASGKNSLVLEISATPYIFTFKMYDWMRLGLDGKPRPININRGLENLYFDRKGKKVKNELISKPKRLEKADGYELYHVPTHKEHFYDVYRYEIKDCVEIGTEGSCNVLVVAEGQSVLLITKNGYKQRFHYGETFVVPEAATEYILRNENATPVKVLKVFLK